MRSTTKISIKTFTRYGSPFDMNMTVFNENLAAKNINFIQSEVAAKQFSIIFR